MDWPCTNFEAWARGPFEYGLKSFFTSAIYFAMAIQIASIYVLAQRDFNVDANGFGVLELKITSGVTAASVLPLLYPIMIGLPEGAEMTPEKRYKRTLKDLYRLTLFDLVIILSLYPFFSQCVHNWAPTDIGEGNGPDGTTIITVGDWSILTTLCFGDNYPLNGVASKVYSGFDLVASLLCIAFAFITTLEYLLGGSRPGRRQWIVNSHGILHRYSLESEDIPWYLQGFFLAGPGLLSIPVLMGIFNLRDVQRSLAAATTNLYIDNVWSFGQIIALVVFFPVIFDMVFYIYSAYFEIRCDFHDRTPPF